MTEKMPIAPDEIRRRAAVLEPEAAAFLREIVRIPSVSGDEAEVVASIRRRMEAVGFDEARIDPFGNVLGRIGHGPREVAFDAHVDTVAVGDPQLWDVDPFGGELHEGIIYGRGAADQKGGMAALVYAGALLKKLQLADRTTVWIVGSVLEEDCDGLCWHYLLNEGLLAPEAVVLTEPTNLAVYRGHRGRMEIEITAHGRSCHGSAPERGINAIHHMAPVIAAIEKLNADLPADAFLGKGSVTTTEIRSSAPSLCAVPDSCTIHLDRRLTAGETDVSAITEVEDVLQRAAVARTTTDGSQASAVPNDVGQVRTEVSVPEFTGPSHTGLVYPMRQYFPAWAVPESHAIVQLALRARALSLGAAGTAGKWSFSTNGVTTMGLHGVPTIGFGPADEVHAHAPTDQCPVAHLGAAIAFYVTFAALFAEEVP
jgi:putative selenium metabolism hydrolase